MNGPLRCQGSDLAVQPDEHRYRTLFETMSAGAALCRMEWVDGRPVDWTYLDVNDAFVAQTGLQAAPGRRLSEVAPGFVEQNRDLMELYGRVAAGGPPQSFERYVAPLEMWIEGNVLPAGPSGFFSIFNVITERIKAAKALADSEELLEQITAMAKIGGWELDLQTTEVTYSRETARIHEVDWPYVPETLSDGHEYYPPEAWPIIQAAVQAAIEHGTSYDLESPFITKKGRHIWVRVQGARVMKDGRPIKLRGTFQDITERRAAQEEIRALNETLEARVLERTAELQAANDELETFSYSVSHDLRAPLRAISGFAELLARRYGDKLDERGRTYVDTIVTSVDHMATLIDELLEYARLGRSVVRSEPVPLGPLVGGLRATFAGRIGATGATFMVAEPLATPVADPVLLERILANLIDNALTYRRPDVAPELILSATAHGRRVTISLTDNGIGIPVEFQERIFAVFTRLHDGDVYEGTGIGLAIVRKAARLMDSDVTVASTLGEGSTFSLDLPAVRSC